MRQEKSDNHRLQNQYVKLGYANTYFGILKMSKVIKTISIICIYSCPVDPVAVSYHNFLWIDWLFESF